MYHKKNVDFAYLLWEDFVYQVEHKDAKKSNEMYYHRFIKVIVNFFMTKDSSIPRRNNFNWHNVRDDEIGSGTDEGTGLIPGVPDVPTYESDEEISWKSSDKDDDYDVQQSKHDENIYDQSDDESHDDQEDDDDQDNEDDDQTDSDNDGDDFVHPKFST
nr:hypothetical protein [Tanacetum cinerariifolium]